MEAMPCASTRCLFDEGSPLQLTRRCLCSIRVGSAAEKGCMRVNITDTFHNSSFGRPLQAAGFRTALFGKYL